MALEDQSEGSKALDQREHSRDASAKRVVLRGQNPSDGEWYNIAVVESIDVPGIFGLVVLNPDGSTYNRTPAAKVLIDKTTTTNVVYVGKAPIGTATSSGAWQITKVDKSSSPISITYADAGAFTATWDDRVSEVYS